MNDESAIKKASIEVKGGAYPGREGLVITRDFEEDRVTITGWYDGGCELEVPFSLSTARFCEELHLPTPPENECAPRTFY